MTHSAKKFIGFASLLLFINTALAQEVDEATGLIIDDNLELIKTNCTVCHSAQNIIQQSGNRLTWLGLIRWMQKTQGLREFDADTEDHILDYLATHYGPKTVSYRRTLLSPFLMPPNPYQTVATLTWVGPQTHYKPGDILTIDLTVEFQESYSKGQLDLWVAAHLPNTPDSAFQFMTGTATQPIFDYNQPNPLLTSLSAIDTNYSILKNFKVPPLPEGEYTFYALLVERGANPLTESNRNRSNLIIQPIQLSSSGS